MNLELRGRVALVTGGSEGIGYATAEALAREGATVVIVARREAALRQAAERITASLASLASTVTYSTGDAGVRDASDTGALGNGGGAVTEIAADVSRAADVERVLRQTLDRFGRLDVLVNNAGTSRAAKFETVTDEVWQEDLDLKLFGAIRACRLAIPAMRQGGGGSIVNVLNIGAKQPGAASVPTSVSRAAGMALTKALSKEFAPDNIRVNAVLIGLVKSGQHERTWRTRAEGGEASGVSLEAFYAGMAAQRGVPLGRVAEAREAGDLIAFLCSPRAAYITGTAINFDGGTSAVV